ncbi:uncharacterized protein LOC111123979 isoform X6 [Crassostrea virginica]
MGIVFSHTIVSLFLHYRNRHRYDAQLQDDSDQTSIPERLADQEALSLFDDVARIEDLYETIKEALSTLLHRKVNSIVYILDENSEDLFADKEKKHAIPSKGIVRETLDTQQFHIQSNDVATDPVIAVIKAQCKPPTSWNPKIVYCLPVADEENQKILALLVIEENETVEINKITPLKHKILGCYRRLCKCHRDSSSNYAPSNAPNPTAAIGKSGDKDAILRLCGDLYDQDASRLQLKVIRFLEEQTNAECAFLLLVVPETQELFCQVIGGHVLEEEIKFPGQNSVFSLPLESKKPMKLEDVPLDKRKDIENLVGVKLKSMLCVPVSSRNSDGLIALACVVNKKDTEHFTNDDLQAILQCFQYTSTVLTSTLAFQNERKLKLQTQAMLQVARNLFTHLGEFSVRHNHNEGLVNCNSLTQFLVQYREQILIPNRKRRESVHRNSNGSAKSSKSESIAESTLHELEKVDACCSPLHSASREASPKNFKSHLVKSHQEKMESFCASESQKSVTKKKYFKSVYDCEEDGAKNGEFSAKFEKPTEKAIVDLESPSDKEYDVNEKKHLEVNAVITQPGLKKSVNDVGTPNLQREGIGASTEEDGVAKENYLHLNISKGNADADQAVVDEEESHLKEASPEVVTSEGHLLSLSENRHEIDVPVLVSTWEDMSEIKQDSHKDILKSQGGMASSSKNTDIPVTYLNETKESAIGISTNREEATKSFDKKDGGKSEVDREVEPDISNEEEDVLKPGMDDETVTTQSVKEERAVASVNDKERSVKESNLDKVEIHVHITDFDKEKGAAAPSDTESDCSDFCLPSVSQLGIDRIQEDSQLKSTPQLNGRTIQALDSLKVPSEKSKSGKSFYTAENLFSNDESSVSVSSDSDGELEERSEIFYDTFTDRSIGSSVSEYRFFNSSSDRSMFASPELRAERLARLSHSEPAISKRKNATRPTSLSLEFKESKPSFNYAFIEERNSNLEPFRISSHDLDSVVESLGLISAQSSSPIIKIIVEDTASHAMHCFSNQNDSKVSARSSVDRFSGRGSGCQFNKHERDLNYIRHQQPPVSDVFIVTINDLTKLLREIMQEARNLTQAERCSVFLIDKETKELVAEVFDGISTNNKEEHNEIRMPITQGIAGHVATTGNLLNIKDAYSHPMFYRGIDDSTGFRTRNILCFPIKNEKGDVLGVAQLCNKKTGQHFTEFDEDLASAFAVYCCISISHCLMYKKLQDSQHRNRLANELMIFHMQISPDDVERLLHREIPSVILWGEEFNKFPFPPREIPEPESPLCVLAMFEDLGFISRWRIRKDTLVRFVLMVKKGYRNPPYHNWTHAFAVAHFCYLCVKNLNLQNSLDDMELLALFVSSLGHDLDHRGTNNQYQMSS